MQEFLYWIVWTSVWTATLVCIALVGAYAIDHWTAWRHLLSVFWWMRMTGSGLQWLGAAVIDAGEALESGWLQVVAEWRSRRGAERTGIIAEVQS